MGKGPSQGAKGRWVEGILGFTTWRLGDAPLGASGWRRICLTSGPAVLFLFHLPCAEAPLHLAGAAQASLRRRGTCLHRLAPPSLPVTRPAEVHLNRCTGFCYLHCVSLWCLGTCQGHALLCVCHQAKCASPTVFIVLCVTAGSLKTFPSVCEQASTW